MSSFILVAMHSLVTHLSGALAGSHLFPLAVTLYRNNVAEQKQNCLPIHMCETVRVNYSQVLVLQFITLYKFFCPFVCPFVTPFESTRSRGPWIAPSIFITLILFLFHTIQMEMYDQPLFANSVSTSAVFFLEQLFRCLTKQVLDDCCDYPYKKLRAKSVARNNSSRSLCESLKAR